MTDFTAAVNCAFTRARILFAAASAPTCVNRWAGLCEHLIAAQGFAWSNLWAFAMAAGGRQPAGEPTSSIPGGGAFLPLPSNRVVKVQVSRSRTIMLRSVNVMPARDRLPVQPWREERCDWSDLQFAEHARPPGVRFRCASAVPGFPTRPPQPRSTPDRYKDGDRDACGFGWWSGESRRAVAGIE